MKIKLAGKAHREGTSTKTGRNYNINIIHYLASVRGVEGQAAQTATLDGVEYPYDTLIVGGEYVIDYDAGGHLVDFAPATKPQGQGTPGNGR